jgi:hypothetical protein
LRDFREQGDGLANGAKTATMLRVSIEPAPPAAVEAASTAKRIMASVKVLVQPWNIHLSKGLFIGVFHILHEHNWRVWAIFVTMQLLTTLKSGWLRHGISNRMTEWSSAHAVVLHAMTRKSSSGVLAVLFWPHAFPGHCGRAWYFCG